MTPDNQGRHCAACNKVVVDFTRMSDAELLAFLHRQPSTSCGRFTSQQLNRPLLVPVESSLWRRWLAAVALALGLSEVVASSARAQAPVSQLGQQPEETYADHSPVKSSSNRKVTASAASLVLVHGRVLASDTREGLPGVTVLIVGSNMSTSTAADGSFKLLIPADQLTAKRKITLSYSTVGFIKRVQRVRIMGLPIEIPSVQLKTEDTVLGGIAFLPASTN
ncbi:carboxypeptidase-like regulatory domain-containing protein [Hymenobacter lutimineralis]|nr:carboxypeptidase-like regulatory domain-containing protein [Hymenobacter lutimineralis]